MRIRSDKCARASTARFGFKQLKTVDSLRSEHSSHDLLTIRTSSRAVVSETFITSAGRRNRTTGSAKVVFFLLIISLIDISRERAGRKRRYHFIVIYL